VESFWLKTLSYSAFYKPNGSVMLFLVFLAAIKISILINVVLFAS